MGVHERAQKVLAGPDHHSTFVAGGIAGIRPGVRGGAIHLYPVLDVFTVLQSVQISPVGS